MAGGRQYCNVPDIECPQCGERFEVGDAFEMGEGSEFQCDHCEAWLEVLDEDVERWWTVGIKKIEPREVPHVTNR